MSARTQMIVAVVLTVLISVLFYFFFIKPRRAELAKVEGDIVAEEQKTQALQIELDHLRELERNAPKLRAELAEIRQLVTTGHEIPNVIFLIQAASNAAGVDFLTITPQLPTPPPEGAAVAQVQVAIDAGGSYFAIQDFIRRLYSLDRALRIDTINLSPTEEITGGGFGLLGNMETRVFFQPPAPPAPEPTAAPADTEAGA